MVGVRRGPFLLKEPQVFPLKLKFILAQNGPQFPMDGSH